MASGRRCSTTYYIIIHKRATTADITIMTSQLIENANGIGTDGNHYDITLKKIGRDYYRISTAVYRSGNMVEPVKVQSCNTLYCAAKTYADHKRDVFPRLV